MTLRAFTQRWWPQLLFPLLFFCIGWVLLPYLGLQYDEVLFANSIFHVPASDRFSIDIFHYHVPLMLMTYLGALKSWVYKPILALFPSSYLTVRLPVLFIGALTVFLFVQLLAAVHGTRAAWIGGLLLATDTSFLLTTSFDWGPVAFQHLLLVSGVLLVWRFAHSGARSALFWGWLCFGLGMWDKALFGWMLSGLVIATVIIFPRETWKRFTRRNALLAAAGFCLGAMPLLAYNVTSGFPTFRSNSFAADEFRVKAEALRSTWNGSALFGYMVNQPWSDHAREAQGTLEQASFGLHSAFGDHPRTPLEGAFYAALLLVPVLWFTRARRMILFALVALAIAWFQMAITKNAGKAAHHAVLLWPLPHFVLAIAFAEASLRLQRIGRWLVIAVVLYLAGVSLLVTNQYFYQLARFGPARAWSDAIQELSDEVGRRPAPHVIVDDWGILNQLVLLHRGSLPLQFADDKFLSPTESDEQKKWDRDELLEQGLWLGHTADNEEFGNSAKIVQAAAGAGFRKQVLRVISDGHGRPTFEIFRFQRGQLP